MQRRVTMAIGAAVAAVGAVLAAAVPANAATLPVHNDFGDFFSAGLHPDTPPPGANDWSCQSSAHPIPVILVHGTWENQNDNFHAMSPYLKNAGYCLYSFNYGGDPGGTTNGWKHIPDNAAELATFVSQVRARTGAAKVDLVGHSQGGMMPRYYIKFLGGYQYVDKLVGISPSNHGTNLSGLQQLGDFLGLIGPLNLLQPAAIDQTIGSPFNAKMDTCPNGLPNADICAGDPTQYTVIETNGDQIVTPYQNAFLQGATNITVQNVCPLDFSEHLAIMYDSNVEQMVGNALDPANAKPVKCSLVLPYSGG